MRITYWGFEGHYVLRITYYVLRIGALRGVTYCVLRMRITYWGFEGRYVLRITHYVLRIGTLRPVTYCVLRITYYVLALELHPKWIVSR
jgi:hypothetical protein